MSVHLPFINKYPYTSFEAVNIDWLLTQVSKIPVLEEKVNQHETRITSLEGTVADHETRLAAAEDEITSLDSRMDTAESEIDTLQTDVSGLGTRMNAAEGSISALQQEVTSAQGDISGLTTRVTNAESDIIALQTADQAIRNDITGLDSRVTTLENEDAVIANPGGTGANLNTISISGTTYQIPSGGSGGGGSSVTPNPSGTATDTLNKVDIDGTVYGMPLTSAEVSILNSTIQGIQSDVSSLQADVSSINSNEVFITEVGSMTANGNVQEIPNTSFQFSSTGTYLITAALELNTSNYGSAPRYIGFYLRDDDTNILLDKFSVRGDEPAMITQAADLSLSAIIQVDQINITEIYKLCLRVSAASNKSVSYAAKLRVTKLNDDDGTNS